MNIGCRHTNDDCDLKPKGRVAGGEAKAETLENQFKWAILRWNRGDLTGKLSIPFGQVRFHIISITIDNINFTVAQRFISVTNNVIYAEGTKHKRPKESKKQNDQRTNIKQTTVGRIKEHNGWCLLPSLRCRACLSCTLHVDGDSFFFLLATNSPK